MEGEGCDNYNNLDELEFSSLIEEANKYSITCLNNYRDVIIVT